jgi:hypothetical protein
VFSFLEWLVMAIVWAVVNAVYIDLRLTGTKKGRLLLFIAGYPATLISYFLVKEGQVLLIEPPEEDEERLLREVREDRELREDARVGLGEERDDVGEEAREAPPGN